MRFYTLFIFFMVTIASNLAAQELLTNGDFENTSSTAWVASSSSKFGVAYGSCTTTGAYGRYANTSTALNISEYLTQSVKIPANTAKLKVSFDLSISTREVLSTTAYDSLFIVITDGTSSYGVYYSNLGGDAASFAGACTRYLTRQSFEITTGNLIGQCNIINAAFVMLVVTDGSNPTVFRIDNVSAVATASPCIYSLSGNGQMAATGGSGSITISTGNCCSWAASSTCPSWITLSQTSGVGPKTITYTAAANTTTSPRSCVITIGNMTFIVSQAGATPCAFALNETTKTFNSSGGSGSFNLIANGSGCLWTIIQTNCGFVTLSTATSGSGSGVVNYTVASNTGTARICTLNIGGQNYIISQDGAPQCALIVPVVKSLNCNLLYVDDQANCTYQWYKNGVPIPAATTRFLNITLSGIYTCKVALNNDLTCSKTSGDFPVSCSTKTREVEGFNALKMFPNPSQGQFQVSFELATSRSVRFLCYNSVGQQVYTSDKGRMSGQVDENIVLPQLPSGLYLFVIVLDGTQKISQAITIRN